MVVAEVRSCLCRLWKRRREELSVRRSEAKLALTLMIAQNDGI
jgi:hypothetical protein